MTALAYQVDPSSVNKEDYTMFKPRSKTSVLSSRWTRSLSLSLSLSPSLWWPLPLQTFHHFPIQFITRVFITIHHLALPISIPTYLWHTQSQEQTPGSHVSLTSCHITPVSRLSSDLELNWAASSSHHFYPTLKVKYHFRYYCVYCISFSYNIYYISYLCTI